MTKDEAQAALDGALIVWNLAKEASDAAAAAMHTAERAMHDASRELQAASAEVYKAQHAYADVVLKREPATAV